MTLDSLFQDAAKPAAWPEPLRGFLLGYFALLPGCICQFRSIRCRRRPASPGSYAPPCHGRPATAWPRMPCLRLRASDLAIPFGGFHVAYDVDSHQGVTPPGLLYFRQTALSGRDYPQEAIQAFTNICMASKSCSFDLTVAVIPVIYGAQDSIPRTSQMSERSQGKQDEMD